MRRRNCDSTRIHHVLAQRSQHCVRVQLRGPQSMQQRRVSIIQRALGWQMWGAHVRMGGHGQVEEDIRAGSQGRENLWASFTENPWDCTPNFSGSTYWGGRPRYRREVIRAAGRRKRRIVRRHKNLLGRWEIREMMPEDMRLLRVNDGRDLVGARGLWI